MKTLFAISTIALSLIANAAFAADPNDPLSAQDMQCTTTAQSDFCGEGTPTDTYNQDSCFERVSVDGCKIVMGASSPFCSWGLIFNHGIKSQTPEQLCQNETKWCNQHQYSDCAQVTQNCIAYNSTFQNVCLKQTSHS